MFQYVCLDCGTQSCSSPVIVKLYYMFSLLIHEVGPDSCFYWRYSSHWLDLAGSGMNMLISGTRPEAFVRVGLGFRAEELELSGLSK